MPHPSYASALAFIEARSNYARGSISSPSSSTGGPQMGLIRTRALLDALGAPDRAYPIVHIAGSKGKGSTSAFLATIGKAAGYRTGLSTSPHLHSFRERMAIDGMSIDQAEFAHIANQVRNATETIELERPEFGATTAFEILTAMALLYFAEMDCELAVVEVGLGGAFDATNVVTSAVSVITRLDLEHTQVLGDTLAEIAANKAGIIEPGRPVIAAWQAAEALDVIEQTARASGSLLLAAGRDFSWQGNWQSFAWADAAHRIDNLRSGLIGNHQMENASLAIAAWRELAHLGFHASDDAIRAGIAQASLPGRFEQVATNERTWILDGAHTPVSAAALADAIIDAFGQPIGAIVGLLRDKHPAEFFDALAPAISHLIVTQPKNPRAVPADDLILTAPTVDSQTVASKDLETSLVTARERFPDGLPVVITGSFTLVAEARERFGLALPDR
ncbi:MAG: folylpolyglutamate synthase/dihydrofolate synthase family protein [Thermomicrobiales bacterium]